MEKRGLTNRRERDNSSNSTLASIDEQLLITAPQLRRYFTDITKAATVDGVRFGVDYCCDVHRR